MNKEQILQLKLAALDLVTRQSVAGLNNDYIAQAEVVYQWIVKEAVAEATAYAAKLEAAQVGVQTIAG